MASIDSGGGNSGRLALNHQLPLVPFIDLLLCCVMFLLVTAVWNQLAQLSVRAPTGGVAIDQPIQEPNQRLTLLVQRDGFTLVDAYGASSHLPLLDDAYDHAALVDLLIARKRLTPEARTIELAPEDGVVFEHVAAALDTTKGAGFDLLTLGDGGRR